MLKLKPKETDNGLTTTSLALKYRPTDWGNVIGQDEVVQSLLASIASNKIPHAFLFTGPSGVGKTTLGRLVAKELSVGKEGLIEIDAASFSGVSDMRDLTGTMLYRSFGASPRRAIIVDECHSLSKPAWQALLKTLEEPPPHVFWILCTTEPDKVPPTIKTRAYHYNLRSVSWEEIVDWLTDICQAEGIKLDQTLVNFISRKSSGSPRQAITYLGMCAHAQSKEQVAALINESEASIPAIELARMVCKGQGLTWVAAVLHVQNLDESNMESVRLMIYNYVAKALLDAKGDKEATRLANILQAFSKPYNASEHKGPLLISLAEVIFG